MNKMSFTLNPCKACWEKYNRGECSINNVNSCLTDTAAAFSGMPSNNFIRGTAAGENWSNCMEKMMKAQGRTPCDFQLDMAPVWNQVPHYFPGFLAETGDPEKSQRSCMQSCSELRHNKKACMQNCVVDKAAVEAYNPRKTRTNSQTFTDYNKESKKNPVVFWIAFSISALVLAFVLAMFYRALFFRK